MDKHRQDRVLGQIRRLSRLTHVIEKYQKSPHTYGTTDKLLMNEVHFISAVDDSGTEMGVIAERLAVTRGAVSQTAAKLEKKGYVTRERDPADGRKSICQLTDAAKPIRNYHTRLDKRNYGELFSIMEDFSEQDLDVCDRFLQSMETLYNMSIQLETDT